jgi:protein transport protein SEC9
MKKFGLGKKGDGDGDSGRTALFGSRSKNKSPAPLASNNPYAQATPPDPYTQAKMNAGIIAPIPQNGGPRPPPGAGRGLPSGPSMKNGYGGGKPPTGPQGNYAGDERFGATSGGYGTGGGYGDNKYGNTAGYGQEKFGSDPYGCGPPPAANSTYGGSGYGGLQRSNSNETTTTEANRDALFGGARQRVQQNGQNGYGQPPPYDTNPAQNADQGQNYGAYGDRQLTAEEEEEEDVSAMKQEIKFIKQQDVSSTRNMLQVAAQAEEVGRNTLARLGAQGERLHNTERNLDLSANHQRVAEEKAKQLKIANRSMFRMHVDNPFTQRGRDKRDQDILDKHRAEREQREVTRQAAFESGQRMNQTFKGIGAAGAGGPKTKTSLAERAKYQFEADSEDDQMEDEIENNLDEISQVTGRLRLLAEAQGEELKQQNKLLEGLGQKVRMAVPVPQNHHTDIFLSERPSGRSTAHESKTTRAYPLMSLLAGILCKYQPGSQSTVHWELDIASEFSSPGRARRILYDLETGSNAAEGIFVSRSSITTDLGALMTPLEDRHCLIILCVIQDVRIKSLDEVS